jgi:hypothetical protein
MVRTQDERKGSCGTPLSLSGGDKTTRPSVGVWHLASAEVTPMRGDDEEHTADCQRHARDDRPSAAQLELRNLCSDDPDPGEQQK